MSKAGIHSRQGDGYPTLVAFELALDMLSDSNFEWLEINSLTGFADEVVVGKADGAIICCPCKKNQPASREWSIKELSADLLKAGKVLNAHPKATVRFYSRSSFGELHALREYCACHTDELSYQSSLDGAHKETDAKLKELKPGLSTYEFLSRTSFVISQESEHMKAQLYERLHLEVTNSPVVFNALWARLEQLRARLSNTATLFRLTKNELQELVRNAGSMLAPAMNIQEMLNAFKGTSAVGRTWRREIGHERLKNPLVDSLMKAIEEKKRSILLQGAPGSGKTCVMLSLQEELEKRAQEHAGLCPLFIQLGEFADKATAQERQALGLDEQWVKGVARIADEMHVVVVMDSVDLLSIAREHSILDYFLAQMDCLLSIPNVTVVAACREFDRHYDRRIAQHEWSLELSCQPLDWEMDVVPLLTRHGIDSSLLDDATRALIRSPRELDLFVQLAQQGKSFNAKTRQALAKHYLQSIVQANNASAMQALEELADEMLKQRSLAIPKQQFSAQESIRALLSHNILHETQNGKLTFGHQTLLDVLLFHGAMRKKWTLENFIQSLPPVPFVRPTIRSFVEQLANEDQYEFKNQLRTVLSGNHALHIRQLVAECWAEQIPCEQDPLLVHNLRNTDGLDKTPVDEKNQWNDKTPLDECENPMPPLEKQPCTAELQEGVVTEPLSFETFLKAKYKKLLRFLENPHNHFPPGTEREVGQHLREAVSRHANWFLTLLSAYWTQIESRFRDNIMDGVADYLAYRHGEQQPSSSSWAPLENTDTNLVAQKVLAELEKHPGHWRHNRSAAHALQSCSYAVQATQDAEHLVFLALGFETLNEKNPASGEDIEATRRAARAHIAEALIIIAIRFLRTQIAWTDLLAPALRRFVADNPAVLLRRLPELQQVQPELSWELFERALQKKTRGLWKAAEKYLCCIHYKTAAPWLRRLYCRGKGEELQTWGRISALAALQKHIDTPAFISKLMSLNDSEAWAGAASVWLNPKNGSQARKQCLAALEAALSAENQHALTVAYKLNEVFQEETPPIHIPQELIRRHFNLLKNAPSFVQHNAWGFDAWINRVAPTDPSFALDVAEDYLAFVQKLGSPPEGRGNNLTQLLTRLFAQAEEQEASDGGAMLQRVLVLQNTMLALEAQQVNEWLKAAERA
ncbi:MAG: ATP-binding protein [Cystobacterineae bacterium]|nr:ATP-binding protein [Cystobacterineae bacterium]